MQPTWHCFSAWLKRERPSQQTESTAIDSTKQLKATVERFIAGNGQEGDLDYIVEYEKSGRIRARLWCWYVELRPSEVEQLPNVIDPNENIEKLRDALFPLMMSASQLEWWRERKARGGENPQSAYFQQLKKEQMDKVLQEAEEWAKQFQDETEDETDEDVAADVQKEGDGEGRGDDETTIS